MRISGIGPLSVILSQTMYGQILQCDSKLTPKQAET